MFYIHSQEYIIAYKLLINKQTLVGLGIDLLTDNSVEIIEKIVKDFKVHRCLLDYDSLFVRLLVNFF